MAVYTEEQLLSPMVRLRPGDIIQTDNPTRLRYPHYHTYTSDRTIKSITGKVHALFCQCGSILLLD